MPKTRNAFAFRGFDNERILSRRFCKKFREAWQATENRTDAEILDYFNVSYSYDGVNIDNQYALDGLNELLIKYVTPYQKHLKRHVERLTNYINAVANKIAAADETANVADLREHHKRAIKLAEKHKHCADSVDGLKKKLSKQYKAVEDEIGYQYRKSFGERLRQARLAAGLTQAQLGESLQLSQKAISGYEVGAREPNLAQMVRFAYKLNRPVDWFLGVHTYLLKAN